MPRAIWSAVSGLDNHQTWMDAIGNNIANVNTAGYKDARYEFEDILSQSLRGAAPPAQGGIGGTNPQQVGLGSTTGSIDTVTTQGSLQQTGLPTDIAVQGQGYYIVSDGVNQHYTRDSVFHVDAAGNIVSSSTGLHLQGTVTDGNGNLQPQRGLQNLTIPQTVNQANNTNFLDMFGNLNSQATTPVTQQVTVLDSLGQSHTVVLTFTPANNTNGQPGGTGQWAVTATSPDLANQTPIALGNVTFDGTGKLTSGGQLTVGLGNTPWTLPGTTTPSTATQGNVVLQLNDPAVGSLTSFAAPTAVSSQQAPNAGAGNRAGNPAGFLKSFSIGPDGTIRGQYSSGYTQTLGQLQLATFANPAGLQRIGQNDWDVTSDSGAANISAPGSGSSGTVAQGSIETSNVQLADELSGMILAERGFQANSRMITTSDEMLQDVVQMKR